MHRQFVVMLRTTAAREVSDRTPVGPATTKASSSPIQVKPRAISIPGSRNVFVRPVPPAGGDPNAGNDTALQKHVKFFDFNGDGKIAFGETYEGLRRLGVGRIASFAFAGFINGVLGPKTTGRATLSVDVANIHLGKHPSDSGAFDAQGRFVPEKFERMFDVFDTNKNGKLSLSELVAMIHANKVDKAGNFGSKAEFGLLLYVAGQLDPSTGEWSMSRDQVRQLYNGSLFYDLEAQVAKGKGPTMSWAAVFRELRDLATT